MAIPKLPPPQRCEKHRQYTRNCEECKRLKREYQKWYYYTHLEIERERSRERMRLLWKTKPEEMRKRLREYYKKRPEVFVESTRKWDWENKLAVFKMFGGKCQRCGISDVRVLVLHHKNSHGSEHRRRLKNKYGYVDGKMIYQAILKGEESVENYELLCYNCNIIAEYESGRRKLPKSIKERG